MNGIVDVVIGGAILAAGLSGKMVLIGTQSSGALAGVGAGVMTWGIYKMVRDRRERSRAD